MHVLSFLLENCSNNDLLNEQIFNSSCYNISVDIGDLWPPGASASILILNYFKGLANFSESSFEISCRLSVFILTLNVFVDIISFEIEVSVD